MSHNLLTGFTMDFFIFALTFIRINMTTFLIDINDVSSDDCR